MLSIPRHKDFEERAFQLGISLPELCRRAGISPQVFSRWKAGETSPTLDKLEKVASVIAELQDQTKRKSP
jgi:predicted transcriptional regulator